MSARAAQLSSPDTKSGRHQRACLELMREHERDGTIPTNGRFVFYELEQRGVIPKHYLDEHGKKRPRQPNADITEALMHLRRLGLVPWHWITDETREVADWQSAPTIAECLRDALYHARIDPWSGSLAPLIICESRATKGVLERIAMECLVPITATNGQWGGLLVTDVVPYIAGNNRGVGYIGDHEIRSPADQIEHNTRRYLQSHTNRQFDDATWTRIALTQAQVDANPRLLSLVASVRQFERIC
jgi:hypothetical protein